MVEWGVTLADCDRSRTKDRSDEPLLTIERTIGRSIERTRPVQRIYTPEEWAERLRASEAHHKRARRTMVLDYIAGASNRRPTFALAS